MNELLSLLEHDARRPLPELAAVLKRSEYDVEKELKALENDRVILGYNTLIDWNKAGADKVTAVIEVNEMLGSEVNLHADCMGDNVVMVIPTVDLTADVSMGATVKFTTQPRLIQLFDKASSNNLIWFDQESFDNNAPTCKSYDF